MLQHFADTAFNIGPQRLTGSGFFGVNLRSQKTPKKNFIGVWQVAMSCWNHMSRYFIDTAFDFGLQRLGGRRFIGVNLGLHKIPLKKSLGFIRQVRGRHFRPPKRKIK